MDTVHGVSNPSQFNLYGIQGETIDYRFISIAEKSVENNGEECNLIN